MKRRIVGLGLVIATAAIAHAENPKPAKVEAATDRPVSPDKAASR